MNKVFYPAIFTKEDVGYSVRFPDMPGCFTEGDTLEEAYAMANEAMGLYLMDNEDNSRCAFPRVSDVCNIETEKNEQIVLIEFDPVDYLKRHSSRAVKKTLTIPEWLNTLAEENNINFSNVLQSALMERLNV